MTSRFCSIIGLKSGSYLKKKKTRTLLVYLDKANSDSESGGLTVAALMR